MAALTSSGGESRYRLSKRPRTGVTTSSQSSGNSSSDLEASFTTAPRSIDNDSLGTVKSRDSQKSTRDIARDDDILVGGESGSSEEDEIDFSKRMRTRSARSGNRKSKAANMRLQLGLSQRTSSTGKDGLLGSRRNNSTVESYRNKSHSSKYSMRHPDSTSSLEGCDARGKLISPIRRRSFFTPGLATRNPMDMLAKPPATTKIEQAEWEDYYYNTGLSAASPLERIAALDLAGRPITPLTRAVTPADRDYGLIGRLRITNGAASPVPSTRTLQAAVARHSAILDGSFTSMEALPADSEFKAVEIGHPTDIILSAERPFSQDSLELNYADIFGYAAGWSQRRDGYVSKFHEKKCKIYSPLSSPDISTQIAEDYMSDLDKNPFKASAADPVVQSFQATTKPSEIEAELFAIVAPTSKPSFESLHTEDLVLPEIASSEDGFQNCTSRLLARVGKSTSTLNTTGEHNIIENTPCFECPPDNGYHSSSSTASYRKELGFHCGYESSEAFLFESDVLEDQNRSRSTPKGRRRPNPVTIPTASTFYSSIFSTTIQSSTDSVPTLSMVGMLEQPKSPRVTPKKLQKTRPRSLPPPANRITVQFHPAIDPESVPYVPNELVDRMVQRSAELPPLIHTLPSIGHIRLEREDNLTAPLSAPMRFPSPQPMVDRIWEQNIFAASRRSKTRRDRHKSAETKRTKKYSKSTSVSSGNLSNMTSLEDIDSFLKGSNTSVVDTMQSDPIPCRSGPIRTLRSPSSTTHSGTVIHHDKNEASQMSRAQSVSIMEHTKLSNPQTRNTSSVYTDNSPAMASSVWTDATPFLRQSSSVWASSPRLDGTKLSSRATSASQFPLLSSRSSLPVMSMGTSTNNTRSLSSGKQLHDHINLVAESRQANAALKDLPPTPIGPSRHATTGRRRSKTVGGIDKDLPPLPHQRKISDHVAPKGLSPCRESDDLSTTRQETIPQRSPTALKFALDFTSRDRPLAKAQRPVITQPEPLFRTSMDCLPALNSANESPSPARQPRLPQLTIPSHRQEISKPRTPVWDSILQSPECDSGGFTSDSTSYCSYSPERSHYKWEPPKPESTHYRRHSDWPQILQDVPSRWRDSQISWDHDMMQTQLIPEGLQMSKARNSDPALLQFHSTGDYRYRYGHYHNN